MTKVIYIFTYIVFKGISLLPYRAIYVLSDLFYLLIYYLIGYRKSVVFSNLKLVFPQYSDEEHLRIAKAFYKHLCDEFFEMLKLMSVSKSEIIKRFQILNPEVISKMEAKEKSIIFLYAHYCTFEYSAAFTLYGLNFNPYGVYKKIRNEAIDKLIKRIRGRFGVEMIDKNDLPKVMFKNKIHHQKAIYGMIADQSPKAQNIKHWTTFLGIETPVFVGAEVLAKRLDHSMCYMKIDKVKRGFYEVELIPLTTEAKTHQDFEITDLYFNQLEAQIINRPEYYFWSHRRWKHQKKA